MSLARSCGRPALIPFVSDFLFDEPTAVIEELALLNTEHDVFVVLVDAAFAYRDAGRVGRMDRYGGRRNGPDTDGVARLPGGHGEAVRDWQDEVAGLAGATTWTCCAWA